MIYEVYQLVRQKDVFLKKPTLELQHIQTFCIKYHF